MLLKKLIIKKRNGTIVRDIGFVQGLNLIVDETLQYHEKTTGNSVGKTTVLKLIDYCLGADKQIIWQDGENKKQENKEVRDYLVDHDIRVVLILASGEDEIVLERNFRSKTEGLNLVNGKKVKAKDYISTLSNIILPNHKYNTPTFRQVIAHNIRYDEERVANTLKFLGNFVSNSEYEALFLYMLGFEHDQADEKQAIERELSEEQKYLKKLEQTHTLNQYRTMLEYTDSETQELQKKKELFGLNENFDADLNALKDIKADIAKTSSELTQLNLKVQLINESLASLDRSIVAIDTDAVKYLYQEAKSYVADISASFEKLIQYHNHMAQHKKKYVGAELPQINDRIQALERRLSELLVHEDELTRRLAKKDPLGEIENTISLLQMHSSKKGEYEALIAQITQSQNKINGYYERLQSIQGSLYSQEFQKQLQERIDIFNRYFQKVSNDLYGEAYSLSFRLTKEKNDKTYYEFSAFNANSSSGKKQGEVLCFDLAYQMYKRHFNIDGLDFLLNDKKELMHGNQLLTMAKYVQKNQIQLVVSVLNDKLPYEIMNHGKVVLRLSQKDKLFKIR